MFCAFFVYSVFLWFSTSFSMFFLSFTRLKNTKKLSFKQVRPSKGEMLSMWYFFPGFHFFLLQIQTWFCFAAFGAQKDGRVEVANGVWRLSFGRRVMVLDRLQKTEGPREERLFFCFFFNL